MDEKFIRGLATDPRVLDVMVELMGPDVTMLSIHVFREYQKRPQVVRRVASRCCLPGTRASDCMHGVDCDR